MKKIKKTEIKTSGADSHCRPNVVSDDTNRLCFVRNKAVPYLYYIHIQYSLLFRVKIIYLLFSISSR